MIDYQAINMYVQ